MERMSRSVTSYLPAQIRSPLQRAAKAARAQWIRIRLEARASILDGRRKIIYALTPPPTLRNIGDQAQAVAIHRWLAKHYPGLPVLEVDKDEVIRGQDVLKSAIGPDDLIFLHSGGNLGDRGMWSETGRRLMIANFRENRIISLPQTIFFSDTPTGREQREISRRIYAEHPRLTIIGRDPVSAEIAQELFPSAQILCMPDFVLSLDVPVPKDGGQGVLLCLRQDKEAWLTAEDHAVLLGAFPGMATQYDTTIADAIPRMHREAVLGETLALFGRHRAVVTDRFHGLIFAVLLRRPTVVLQTVDHKLTSGFEWFKDVPFVAHANTVGAIADRLDRCSVADSCELPNWNALYFDRLPELLNWPANQ